VLEATGVGFDWDVQIAGEGAMATAGTPLPEAVLASLRENRVGLKGPITTPVGSGYRSVNVTLRQTLGLYACVRPVHSFPGLRDSFGNVDLVVIRENSEDLYSGVEFAIGSPEVKKIRELAGDLGSIHEDSAIALKPISRGASTRIARFAFEYARKNGRKRVTAVHKANIMKLTDGLFLESVREVSRDYREIAFDEHIVDSLCMRLVREPDQFDVLVTPNLYGDIISDLAAGLVGGLGVAPGANLGDGIALFEPTHGSAPQFAGSNRLNPIATILSGELMLRHLGEAAAAARLGMAVQTVVENGDRLTFDLHPQGAPISTVEMADAIIEILVRSSPGQERRREVI
jgi:isocitrate dehydrogenase (NAD+)